MPHEVIMPALGMAQETGLIVAWHKAAGDKVAPGDVLMEVETDKATMAVEAQAEGFLTNVRASEGEAVPVGSVIATISESADVMTEAPVGDRTPNEEASTPVDGKSVIMPALGMAQDTGVLLAWRKQLGDVVSADEILLEVETDKSAMEVEAGHDGYVAELRATPGDNVPVGDVIAIISKVMPEKPVQRRAATAPASPALKTDGKEETGQQDDSVPAPAPAAKTATTHRAAVPESGRILASPKAKRLAAERSLDLARLVESGHPQPYHVADLDRLAELAVKAPATTPSGGARDSVTARAPASGYAEFRTWMRSETGSEVDNLAVWAAFATAGFRASVKTKTLTIRAEAPLLKRAVVYADSDLSGLGHIEPAEDAGAPALVLRDLTGSRVTGATLSSDPAPVLTITAEGGDYLLTLEAVGGTLPADAAITIISEMAARLEEPLRHLL